MESAVRRRIEREIAWKTIVTGAEITISIGIMTGTMADCTYTYIREDSMREELGMRCEGSPARAMREGELRAGKLDFFTLGRCGNR